MLRFRIHPVICLLTLEHSATSQLMRQQSHLIDPLIDVFVADLEIGIHLVNSYPSILHRTNSLLQYWIANQLRRTTQQ